jgi:hypothetical protein
MAPHQQRRRGRLAAPAPVDGCTSPHAELWVPAASHWPPSDCCVGEASRGERMVVSYGPWAHYSGGYQDRLVGGPLGLLDLCYTAPIGVERKDYRGIVLG